MTYARSPMTEAQAEAIDNREPFHGQTLPSIASNPATAEALLQIRGLYTRDRMIEMRDRPKTLTEEDDRRVRFLWRTMPGYTCFSDALRLLARF